MKLFDEKHLFYLFFNTLFLLLFLFGETFLGLFVLAFFAMFFLVSSLYYKHNFNVDKISVFLWGLFLFSVLISTIFSHSIPMSLTAISFYFFSFIVYVFFSCIAQKTKKEIIVSNILLVSLVLNALGIFFFFYPTLAKPLPELNLLFASHGHNHLGALVLMLIPISWYLLLKKTNNMRNKALYSFFHLILLFNLFFSFGRVVIFIGLIQFFCIFIFLKKKISLKKTFLGNFFLLTLFFFFLAVLFGFLLFIFNNKHHDRCLDFFSQLKIEDQLCKDFAQEPRAKYWSIAFNAIKENPIWGYGPGTYSLIDMRYKKIPTGNTIFAHNSIIQITAESGLIVGFLFFILILYLYIRSFFIVFKNKNFVDNLDFYLLLGAASSLLNSFMDFDWSFISIFSLTIIFLALITTKSNPKKDEILLIKAKAVKLFYMVTVLFLVLFSVFVLITEYFIYQKDVNKAISFFPYYKYHFHLFLEKKNLTEISKNKLMSIYTWHSEATDISSVNLNKLDKINKIKKIDPWFFYNDFTELEKIENTNKKFYEDELNFFYTQKINDENKKFGFYYNNKNIAVLYSQLADTYLLQGNTNKAILYYIRSIEFDENVWKNTLPAFVYMEFKDKNYLEFWPVFIEKVNVEYFGELKSEIAKNQFSFLDSSIEKLDTEAYLEALRINAIIADWESDLYVINNLSKINSLIDHELKDRNIDDALAISRTISSVKVNYWAKLHTLFLLLSLGQLEDFHKEKDNCLKLWNDVTDGEIHYHCSSIDEKTDITDIELNKQRYIDIKKVILEPTEWQKYFDF